LCETLCPVGINTGTMSKAIRGRQRGATAHWVAGLAARHYGTAMGLARTGLRAASIFDAVTGGYGLDAAGGILRRAFGSGAPLLSHRVTPKAGSRVRRPQAAAAAERPRAVYFASCAGQMFGPGRDDPDGEALSVTLQRLAEKAGFELIVPPPAESLCCGQPFDSKGLLAEADRKAEEAVGALLQASENGEWPVFSDTSPCSQRLKAAAAGRLQLLDIAEFLHDYILPNVDVPERLAVPVTLHVTCSTRRMKLEGKLLAIAQACAAEVIVPPDIGCCAFAGDKGFTRPEMNAHALRRLRPTIEGCAAGYSTSRTCEIGLSLHGGLPYRSIAHLLDRAARPRKLDEGTGASV
jgi:D-lactate dehydrogenase